MFPPPSPQTPHPPPFVQKSLKNLHKGALPVSVEVNENEN